MINEDDLIRHLAEGGEQLWEPSTPPPLDLAAITGEPSDAAATDRAASTASRPAGNRSRPRWWKGGTRPALGLAVGALACIAMGIGLGAALFGDGEPATVASTPITTPTSTPTPIRQVSLERFGSAPEGAAAIASVFATSDGETIDVRVSGMPPLAPGHFYELWALGAKGRMISLGNITIDADGNGATSIRVPVSLSQFPVLDISLETADGNPRHSGDSMLRSTA